MNDTERSALAAEALRHDAERRVRAAVIAAGELEADESIRDKRTQALRIVRILAEAAELRRVADSLLAAGDDTPAEVETTTVEEVVEVEQGPDAEGSDPDDEWETPPPPAPPAPIEEPTPPPRGRRKAAPPAGPALSPVEEFDAAVAALDPDRTVGGSPNLAESPIMAEDDPAPGEVEQVLTP
jgi:hypothetical protein